MELLATVARSAANGHHGQYLHSVATEQEHHHLPMVIPTIADSTPSSSPRLPSSTFPAATTSTEVIDREKVPSAATKRKSMGYETKAGSCPGGGVCNGQGGMAGCQGCPAFNNRVYSSSNTVASSSKLSQHASTSNVLSEVTMNEIKSGSEDSEAGGAMECNNCKTKTTPLWRKDGEGNYACNACGLYYKLHGAHRPVEMMKPTIKRRKRIPAAIGPQNRTVQPAASSRQSSAGAQPMIGESVENSQSEASPGPTKKRKVITSNKGKGKAPISQVGERDAGMGLLADVAALVAAPSSSLHHLASTALPPPVPVRPHHHHHHRNHHPPITATTSTLSSSPAVVTSSSLVPPPRVSAFHLDTSSTHDLSTAEMFKFANSLGAQMKHVEENIEVMKRYLKHGNEILEGLNAVRAERAAVVMAPIVVVGVGGVETIKEKVWTFKSVEQEKSTESSRTYPVEQTGMVEELDFSSHPTALAISLNRR